MLSNILSKTILVLLAAALAAVPILAFTKEFPLNKGVFEDGASVLWQCESKMSVKFMFTTPEGKQYSGLLFCGDQA